MLQQDYLLRMFVQLANAIRESLQRARGDSDPVSAAELLDQSIEDATEMDGALLLRMAPESMGQCFSSLNPILSLWNTFLVHFCFLRYT